MLLTKRQREKRAMEAEIRRLRAERDKAAHTAYAFYCAGAWNLGAAYHDRAKAFSDAILDVHKKTA